MMCMVCIVLCTIALTAFVLKRLLYKYVEKNKYVLFIS